MDRSDVCDISQHLRGGLNEDVALRLSKSVMESNSLREIVEQITALEAVEQTDEIRIILEELKACQSALLEIQSAIDASEKEIASGNKLIINRNYTDDETDMSISDDNGSPNGLKNSKARKNNQKRKKRKYRRVRPWLMVKDEILKSEDIDQIRQVINLYRSSGVDQELTSALWKLIHTKYLQCGHLVAFALRCLNGALQWHYGIVEEFRYDDEDSGRYPASDNINDDESSNRSSGDCNPHMFGNAPAEENDEKQPNVFSEDLNIYSSHAHRRNQTHDHETADHRAPPSQLHSIRVSFATPKKAEQKKCLHHDSGGCYFGTRCLQDHGKWIPPSLVRAIHWYPNTQLQAGDNVIVLPSKAELWTDGTVLCVNREANSDQIVDVHVRLTEKLDVVISNLNRILPALDPADFIGYMPGDQTTEVLHEEDLKHIDTPAEESYDIEHSTDKALDEDALRVETSLLNARNCPEWFAFWEKHTTGFGSRMLRKMGYKMGEPLRPPSWSSNDPQPLIEPLSIKLLPPRVSLDYLLKQRRRGQSAGAVLEFKDYGQEKSEEEEKEQKHNNSTGMFGLMNRNELMQSYTELLQKQADEVKQRDLEHQEALQKTRRGDKSDAILRSDLLNLERRLAILTNELKETERHLGRHSSTGRSSSHLQVVYATAATQKQGEIERIREQMKAIEQRLQTNQSTKRLKIF